MLKLVQNELIKIFKRKNIYILLVIGILIVTCYNLFQYLINTKVDISKQYQRAYNSDKMLLENYNKIQTNESYKEIEERISLEKYAIENNIKYNILLNSQNNNNAKLPMDAKILLMKVFNNFDIIIIFIIVYLSSTILSEEFNNGTIKNLLTKPNNRTKILLSKILVSIFVMILTIIIIVIYQYLLGGLLFGFDSYELEVIRYNNITQLIEKVNLIKYMMIIVVSKTPMYILLLMISLLFGVITNNIALNILISLSLYITSTINSLINNITQYLLVYNWDISKYLYNSNKLINQSIIIDCISVLLILFLLIISFKRKDIKNI